MTFAAISITPLKPLVHKRSLAPRKLSSASNNRIAFASIADRFPVTPPSSFSPTARQNDSPPAVPELTDDMFFLATPAELVSGNKTPCVPSFQLRPRNLQRELETERLSTTISAPSSPTESHCEARSYMLHREPQFPFRLPMRRNHSAINPFANSAPELSMHDDFRLSSHFAMVCSTSRISTNDVLSTPCQSTLSEYSLELPRVSPRPDHFLPLDDVPVSLLLPSFL